MPVPYAHPILHTAVSAAAVILSAAVSLPSRSLHGLHTYIHPDSVAGGDGLRAAISRPSAPAASDPNRRHRSKNHRPAFDESSAQLFRLRINDSHLHTRVFFPHYRAAFLSSSFSLSLLALRFLLPPDPAAAAVAVPAAAASLSAVHLLLSLSSTSFERSASKKSEKQLSVLSGILGFLSALLILYPLSPSVFDFDLGGPDAGISKLTAAALAGCLSGALFMPAVRAARSFWLGTDQLRWNLSVVSCGAVGRVFLHVALVLSVWAPLLWIKPVVDVVSSGRIEEFRVWALLGSAVSQLTVLRPNLQMYVNEAVLCWYQRLHASKAPDLDYGRAKVFLHNHYLCLVVIQFFAPPVMVMLFLGLSQMGGNLFDGLSVPVKEMALFTAWWITLVWGILTMSTLALYRSGFLLIS